MEDQRISMSLHAFQEYLQHQRMEAIENAARGLAHDLRNCLTALKGNLELLEEPKDSFPRRLKTLKRITQEIENLLERWEELYGKRALPKPEACDLNQEVQEIFASLRSSLPEGIKARLKVHPSPLKVFLAPGELWRILTNLWTNAVEALDGQGEIVLSLSRRQVSAEDCLWHGNARPGDFAVLSLKDSGRGIPQEMLKRLFEPGTSLKGKNRGWGLSIVYSLVRRRGGWIHVETQPERGTSFEIYLPLART